MFVKIMVLEKESEGCYPVTIQRGWECKSYRVENFKEQDMLCAMLMIDDEKEAVYPCWQMDIFIMDSTGKTIDSFTWNGLKPPEEELKNES